MSDLPAPEPMPPAPTDAPPQTGRLRGDDLKLVTEPLPPVSPPTPPRD